MTHYDTPVMPKRPITGDWTIDLDDAFERRVEGGEVMFWLRPRTVYPTAFATDAERRHLNQDPSWTNRTNG